MVRWNTDTMRLLEQLSNTIFAGYFNRPMFNMSKFDL